GTAQDRVVVDIVGHREPFKPLRPVLVEVSLDANFIPVHGASFSHVSDASSALHPVCSSTRQDSMYRRMCYGVDFLSHQIGALTRAAVRAENAKEEGGHACLEHFESVGASNRLGATLDAHFTVDAVDVPLHRAEGDDEFLRNRGIGQTLHQQL